MSIYIDKFSDDLYYLYILKGKFTADCVHYNNKRPQEHIILRYKFIPLTPPKA